MKVSIINTTKKTIPLIDGVIDKKNDVFHMLDETILPDISSGYDESKIFGKIDNLVSSSITQSPEVIVIACSTIGNYKPSMDIDIPIIRIDQGMKNVVGSCNDVLVLATNELTKAASCDLFNISESSFILINEAKNAAANGDIELHNKIIAQVIEENINSYEYIILAQASMSGAKKYIKHEKVLSSIETLNKLLELYE